MSDAAAIQIEYLASEVAMLREENRVLRRDILGGLLVVAQAVLQGPVRDPQEYLSEEDQKSYLHQFLMNASQVAG